MNVRTTQVTTGCVTFDKTLYAAKQIYTRKTLILENNNTFVKVMKQPVFQYAARMYK